MGAGFILTSLTLASVISARPLTTTLLRREVPQEHSHEQFLTTVRASLNANNPAGIVDPVFGLLGDGAAAGGLGSISDVECLQQATADQAFTNAKAAGDVNGQVAALIYRTLERNTGSVGAQSNPCKTIQAVNPEIAALSQHQDPASTGAAATNKQVALNLAVQIAAVGGDPTDAIKSGTFAPGTIGDPTAAGHTCDTQNDPTGCIFTQNLLVPDLTADDIASAVAAAGGSAGGATAAAPATSAAAATTVAAGATDCPLPVTVTMTVTINGGGMAMGQATTTSAAAVATSAVVAVAAGSADNLQTFTGALGGAAADAITFSGDDTRPFLVNGNTFVNFAAAAQRTCDIQFNACANQANSGAAFSVSDCQTQKNACDAAQQSATVTSFGSSTAVSAPSTSAAAAPPPASTSSTSTTPPSTSTGALDFGQCPTDPSTVQILFGPGFDGRTEDAFEIANQSTFNHGSADNIKVLTGFICQQLQDKCKASAATLSTCASAEAAANAASGQAAADAWNGAFGA